MPHAASAVLRRLIEARELRLERAKRAAPDSFQLCSTVETHRYVAKLQGRAVSNGRANLERFDRACLYLQEKCGYKLSFQQRVLHLPPCFPC